MIEDQDPLNKVSRPDYQVFFLTRRRVPPDSKSYTPLAEALALFLQLLSMANKEVRLTPSGAS